MYVVYSVCYDYVYCVYGIGVLNYIWAAIQSYDAVSLFVPFDLREKENVFRVNSFALNNYNKCILIIINNTTREIVLVLHYV